MLLLFLLPTVFGSRMEGKEPGPMPGRGSAQNFTEKLLFIFGQLGQPGAISIGLSPMTPGGTLEQHTLVRLLGI